MGYYDRKTDCNCTDTGNDTYCQTTGGGHESDAVMAERREMTRWQLAQLDNN